MMLFKNTKGMVHSPDGDTGFFDIVTGILQGDSLALYFFMFCLHTSDVLRSNKRKWFHIKKARRKQYPAETMTDADYTDDLALLTNTPTQVESLLTWALCSHKV